MFIFINYFKGIQAVLAHEKIERKVDCKSVKITNID